MSYSPLVPLLDSAAVIALIVLNVGFTSSLFPRLACLPIISALTWHCVTVCPLSIPRSAWQALVGGFTAASVLHYLDVAIISHWEFDLQGPRRDLTTGHTWSSSPPKQKVDRPSKTRSGGQILSRLTFGTRVLCSWRFIGTPYEPRGVPLLKKKQPEAKSVFLRRMALAIVICYLVLDLMDASADEALTDRFYKPNQAAFFSRLHEVTFEEVGMRFFAALGLGAGLISVQRGLYSIIAFVCVTIGLHSPSDWPPFNGPFSAIYSLRNFWSVFWHQINTHKLVTISNFLLFEVLHFPKTAVLSRYLRVWTVFFLSALLHVAVDASSGINPRDSGAISFFTIQPLGILIEDLFQKIVAKLLGQSKNRESSAIERCVGVLWVGLWMAWTGPAYLYPVLKVNGPEGGGVVPVSVIGYFKGFS
ncbi:unnamed protein product [Clonostachys rosea]|uniref:Wax synthase domain-containing protein n=1 Tax=Bionectria ochroleuca TaxID=29856 RepID=A0ABY6U6R1_BIOOC|nr:unnamed protein product [Clonostachys rosea]